MLRLVVSVVLRSAVSRQTRSTLDLSVLSTARNPWGRPVSVRLTKSRLFVGAKRQFSCFRPTQARWRPFRALAHSSHRYSARLRLWIWAITLVHVLAWAEPSKDYAGIRYRVSFFAPPKFITASASSESSGSKRITSVSPPPPPSAQVL